MNAAIPVGASQAGPGPTQTPLVTGNFVSIRPATTQGMQVQNSVGTGVGFLSDISGLLSLFFGLSLGASFSPPKDDGTQQATCRVFAGAGVPSNANGQNGDYYLRSDTPGVLNQRLYVKSAGVWVGIL